MKLHINRAEDPLQASLPQTVTCVNGIYIHIPFCTHKCHYCDFYSLTSDSEDDERDKTYISALLNELDFYLENIEFTEENGQKPLTLFIGGGTPSLLGDQAIDQLFGGLNERGILSACEELTVEVNPETATKKKCEKFSQNGVNRISMGAQSFNPKHLKTLERLHNPESVPLAVNHAREAGINNINLDLIFAIPGQTQSELADDLRQAIALTPDHLSCYSLIFEPETALHKRMELGTVTPMETDQEAQMYEFVIRQLKDTGFGHYEISNWSREDKSQAARDLRCQHNLVYWRNQNWLGLGPYAGTHLDGWRWKNKPNLTHYLNRSTYERPIIIQAEKPDPIQNLKDQLMMGLRLREGMDTAIFKRIHDELDAMDRLNEYLKAGYLEILEYGEAERLKFTPKGLLLADALLAEWLY